MAEVPRIQHISPPPAIPHQAQRVPRSDDRPHRDGRSFDRPEDSVDLHDEEAAEASTPHQPSPEAQGLDIAI